MQPTAAMMQQFLADATAQDAPDAAQLAALKAAEKSGGRAPDATALKGQQVQSSDDNGQPATAAATPGEGAAENANLADAQAKHAAIEAVGEATHAHAAKPGHAEDTDQKPGDIAKLADFDAHLAQATTETKVAPDGSAPALGATQPAERAAATATASAPAPGPAATGAVPLAGVAVEIAARAHAGSNRFEIRLDPPELGRIDVRLDVDRDGHVTSRLVVDRPETLDALRRDAPGLERALQQAGLKTSDNGLQFSLRDQSFAGGHQAFQQQQTTTPTFISDSDLGPVDGLQAAYGRVLRAGGLDISV
jgi:flagellar hook-length control protein FliK